MDRQASKAACEQPDLEDLLHDGQPTRGLLPQAIFGSNNRVSASRDTELTRGSFLDPKVINGELELTMRAQPLPTFVEVVF